MSHQRNPVLIDSSNSLQTATLIQLLQPIKNSTVLPKLLQQFAAGLNDALAANDCKKMITLLKAFLTTLASHRTMINNSNSIAQASISVIVQIYHDAMVNCEYVATDNTMNLLLGCVETLLREPTCHLFTDISQLAGLREIVKRVLQLDDMMIAASKDTHQSHSFTTTPPRLQDVLPRSRALMDTQKKALALLDELATYLPCIPLHNIHVLSRKRIEWLTLYVSLQSNHFSAHKPLDASKLSKQLLPLTKSLNEAITSCENELQKLAAGLFTLNTRYQMLESCAMLIVAKYSVMQWETSDSVKLDELLVRFYFLMNKETLDYSNKRVMCALKVLVPFLIILKAYEVLMPLLEKIYVYLTQHEATTPAVFHNYSSLFEDNLVPAMRHSATPVALCTEINAMRNKFMYLAFDRYREDFYNEVFNELQALVPARHEPVRTVTPTPQPREEKIAPKPIARIPLLATYHQSITDPKRLKKFIGFENYLVEIGLQEGECFVIQMNKLNPSIVNAGATHKFTQHELERLMTRSGHPKSNLHAYLKQYYAPIIEAELYVAPAASSSAIIISQQVITPIELPPPVTPQPPLATPKLTKKQQMTQDIQAKLKARKPQDDDVEEAKQVSHHSSESGGSNEIAIAETASSSAREMKSPDPHESVEPTSTKASVDRPPERTVNKTIAPPFFVSSEKNTYFLFGGSNRLSFSIMAEAAQANGRKDEGFTQSCAITNPRNII